MNLDRIVFSWGVGSYGWGVIGINFMLHWPGEAITAAAAPWAELPKDDPRASLLADRITQSKDWQTLGLRIVDEPLLVALGNDLQPIDSNLRGRPTVAFPVFEDVDAVRPHIDQLRNYPLVITASRWNHDVLAEMGIPSRMVHQGYDPVLFHPGIRKKIEDGRFHVYSGGKAEYRKGQDLVLEGFKIFAETHDDAVLHAAWSSPWPALARSFDGCRIGAVPGADIGMPNFRAWAQRAGIKRHQFKLVPATFNHLMPEVLAGMDCAVFASRFEGGTNISAMECIGSGIPTILSSQAGHRDLRNPYPADKSEEIANVLRLIYDTPNWPASPAMDHFAWPARIDELVGVLKDV